MLDTEREGERVTALVAAARQARQRAQARGLVSGADANQRHIDRCEARLARLRDTWRSLQSREGELRNIVVQAGTDPRDIARDLSAASSPEAAELADAIVAARVDAERPTQDTLQVTAQQVIEEQAADPPASVPEGETRLTVVQDALDLVGVTEIVDWAARGAQHFDPRTPAALPEPESDGALVSAIRTMGERARKEVLGWWRSGAAEARAAATADERRALMNEAAADPQVVEATLGRRAVDIGDSTTAADPFWQVARDKVAELAAAGSPLRQAAGTVLLEARFGGWPPAQLREAAAENWSRRHADDLTWSAQIRREWSAWMIAHFREDPLIGTWAGWPAVTRFTMVEQAIPVAFERLAEERPDLVAATAEIPTERLAARIRGELIPRLHLNTTTAKHPLFETGDFGALVLRAKPNVRLGHGPRGWSVTFDGNGTRSEWGQDHRVALGAVLQRHGFDIPDWVDRHYRPVADAVRSVKAAAADLARTHPAYLNTAHSGDALYRYGDGNAIGSGYLREARATIVAALQDYPAAQVLSRAGFELDWFLRREVDPGVLASLKTAPADPNRDITVEGVTAVLVGNPDADHVRVANPGLPERQWLLDDTVHDNLDWNTAISMARQLLVERRTAITETDTPTATVEAPRLDTNTIDRSSDTTELAASSIVEPSVEPELDDRAGPRATDTRRGELGFPWLAGVVDEINDRFGTPFTADTVIDPVTAAMSNPLARLAAVANDVDRFGAVFDDVLRDQFIDQFDALDKYFAEKYFAHDRAFHDAFDAGVRGHAWQHIRAHEGVEPELVGETSQVVDTAAPSPESTEAQPSSQPRAQADPEPQRPGAQDFELGTAVLVPSGARDRVRANIAAVRLVRALDEAQRSATDEEQQVLSGWSGWGAVPEVFDNRPRFREQWQTERGELRELLGEQGFSQARETTLNAHYTDPAVVAEMWRAVTRAGLPTGAVLLEPGCGAGHFVGTAPTGVDVAGVEVEPVSARIAHYLYPSQHIRNHGFERDFAPEGVFDGAIGNVPFGRFAVYDPIHNPDGHSIHNHFILKSLRLTAPGGYVTVLTSAYTSDSRRGEARAAMAELSDLVGAVRLPSGAFDRQAGTQVVTDILLFRRREPDAEPTDTTRRWAGPLTPTALPDRNRGNGESADYQINGYFHQYPRRVLGEPVIASGMRGRHELVVEPSTAAPLATQVRRQLDAIVDDALASGHGFTTAADPDRGTEFRTPGLTTGAAGDGVDTIPGLIRFDETTEVFEQFKVGPGWSRVNCTGREKAAQWRVMLAMGDTVMALTEASRDPNSTRAERDDLRQRLNGLYDGYVAKWGPLNRFTLSKVTPRTEADIAKQLGDKIDEWRRKAGRREAIDEGRDPDKAAPYDGPLPESVLEDLTEKATKPRVPRKVSSHIEGAIARDPRIGMVLGLEKFTSRFDGSDAHTEKAPIFDVDIDPTRTRVDRADTIDEAIAIAVDEHGHPDPRRIAELLGVDITDALATAAGRIYPSLDDSDRWEIAESALSGQVRAKLARAQALAEQDPHRYGALADALTEVVPADIDPSQIGARPGAPWIPLDDYRAFLIEEFKLKHPDLLKIDFDTVSGNWQFATTEDSRHEYADGYTDRFGTSRLTGIELFELMANNRPIQILKTDAELEHAPAPRFEPALTEAARASAKALESRFEGWLWADGDRYVRLTRAFNDAHNSYVNPVFDTTYKQFPGLTEAIVPYSYQRQAVVRFLHDETILLDHVVGAGKTLTMIMSCMEAKRLGQVRQPWVVVPNHLLAQWNKEVRAAYPAAQVLAAADLDGVEDRQRFIGQTAVGDWDIVLVPQSVFGLISMTRDAQVEYIQHELGEMRDALEAARTADREFSVKQIETAIKSAEKRITTILDSRKTDAGLTFEQSGCDFLFIDEAHEYKNLQRTANATDLAVIDGADRAMDLEMKAHYLRRQAVERNEREGHPYARAKAIAFATGTPISNSMSEIWVMTKFLRPDLLADAGLGRIDNWAGVFARPATNVEINITATKLRPVTRMAEYINVPSLIAMIDQYRDVVLSDQIPVRLPTIAGGAPRNVEFDLGQQVIDFVADLDERIGELDAARLDLDNTLKISTDGRNAAMFPPLANLPTPDLERSRIEVAADVIWRCHVDNADVVIPADKYGPDMTGAFQLVFADRGTPKTGDGPSARNVYTELRAALVDRGMATEQIAFMHDYDTPKKKAAMVEACCDGRIRVLITSTKKGGTGLNVQRALKQLINMDPSWTAADMAQRLGRIVRQGNTFEVVNVENLIARRSFDAMMYQYVDRKDRFTQQIRRSDAPPTMEDIGGDFTAGWAQTKAAATGDPVFVEQVEADQLVSTLEAQRAMVHNNNAARDATIRAMRRRIDTTNALLPALRADAAALDGWTADRQDEETRSNCLWTFPNGAAVPDDKSPDLVAALNRSMSAAGAEITRARVTLPIAYLAGVPVTADYLQGSSTFQVLIAGKVVRQMERDQWLDVVQKPESTRGFVQSIRNAAATVSHRVHSLELQVEHSRDRLAQAQAEPELTFAQAAELDAAKQRAHELAMEVNSRENSPEALQQQERDTERRRSAGQYPRWSLDLNPTPAWAKEQDIPKDALIASVPAKMQEAADRWTQGAENREQAKHRRWWKPVDATEYEWRHGFDPNTGNPGARTWWAGRRWHWEAFDGEGARDRGACNTRNEAQRIAGQAVGELAHARGIPSEEVHAASVDRPWPEPADADEQLGGEGLAIGSALSSAQRATSTRATTTPLPPEYVDTEYDAGTAHDVGR